MKLSIADRLKNFDSSKIRFAFELAQNIPDPTDLSIGYPGDNTPDRIKLAGILAIKNNYTTYTSSNGMIELREAIAKKLRRDNNIDTGAENITVTPGLTTGVLLAYLAILNSGDEIIIPEPYFPPYKDLALMIEANPKLINTEPNFQLTAEQIKPLITPKTKIILINSPNNPSGSVYPRKELVKIAKLAAEHDLFILSDEVYEYFSYDLKHFSLGSIYPNTLTLNGFSKAYSMTGWRVGYIHGPRRVIDAINELQQYIVFSTSSISQYAALEAVKQSPKNLAIKYGRKRDLAISLLKNKFPDVKGAQGAYYLFLKLPEGLKDVEFVNSLALRGVVAIPGSAFGNYDNYIRISYGGDENNIRNGLTHISELVEIS